MGLLFEIMRRVVARLSTHRDDLATGVDKVAVTALAAAIDKTGPFQLGADLTHFARHSAHDAIRC